jgi:hypothetical protein
MHQRTGVNTYAHPPGTREHSSIAEARTSFLFLDWGKILYASRLQGGTFSAPAGKNENNFKMIAKLAL